MSLYDEIRAEQAVIADEVASLLQEMFAEAKTSIEAGDRCPPVIASMVGSTITYYHPTWRSDFERGKVFENINAEMDEHDIVAAVATFHGSFAKSMLPIKNPRNHPNSLPAIILVARLAWGQQAMVYPYRKDGEKIEWLDEIELDEYPSSLRHPCVN